MGHSQDWALVSDGFPTLVWTGFLSTEFQLLQSFHKSFHLTPILLTPSRRREAGHILSGLASKCETKSR